MKEKLLLGLHGVDRLQGYRWRDKPECLIRASLGLEGLSSRTALPPPPPPFGSQFSISDTASPLLSQGKLLRR